MMSIYNVLKTKTAYLAKNSNNNKTNRKSMNKKQSHWNEKLKRWIKLRNRHSSPLEFFGPTNKAGKLGRDCVEQGPWAGK